MQCGAGWGSQLDCCRSSDLRNVPERKMYNTSKNRSRHTSVSSEINSVVFSQYLRIKRNFKGKHSCNLWVSISFPFPFGKLCGDHSAQAHPGQQRASISDKWRLSRTEGQRGISHTLDCEGFPFCFHHQSPLKLSFYWATESLVFSCIVLYKVEFLFYL